MSVNTNAPDDYIELLEFSDKFINGVLIGDVRDIFSTFIRIFKWGEKFMSPEHLLKIDQMHTELYAKYTQRFRSSLGYLSINDCW